MLSSIHRPLWGSRISEELIIFRYKVCFSRPRASLWGILGTSTYILGTLGDSLKKGFPEEVHLNWWCPDYNLQKFHAVIVVRHSWTSTFLWRCGRLFSHWEWLGMCEVFPQVATQKDPGLTLETFSPVSATIHRLVVTARTVDICAYYCL